MTWQKAVDYCSNYSEYGVNNWRLPNISELKLLNKCSSSKYSCDVSEPNNLSMHDDWNKESCSCDGHSCSFYHELGDDSEQSLWSSSVLSDTWHINFTNGEIHTYNKLNNDYVRCVRSE